MADRATAQERLSALREQVARLEGKALPQLAAAGQEAAALDPQAAADRGRRLAFGIESLDQALEGGLPLGGMTEIRSRLMADTGAASGLVLSLAAHARAVLADAAPVLWIGDAFCAREAGLPYAAGLKQFGLDPQAVICASPRDLEDALWLAEAALTSRALCVVVLEIHGNLKHFGLTESRRLSLRAKAAERPFFLLRQAGEEEAGSASFRFLAEPAPALKRRLPDGTLLGGSMGNPVFRLTLEKSRNPAPVSFLLEWNPHDRHYALVHDTAGTVPVRNPPAHPGAFLSASVDGQDRPANVGAVMAFGRPAGSSAHPVRRPA